jgi:hypothetical protein
MLGLFMDKVDIQTFDLGNEMMEAIASLEVR